MFLRLAREQNKEIDTHFYEKYWHVLQTIQGALEEGRRSSHTSLEINHVDDGVMIAKLFINS